MVWTSVGADLSALSVGVPLSGLFFETPLAANELNGRDLSHP